MRNLSLPRPISRSQVHLTSAAVKGLPSCHLTPWRNGKVSSLPSSLHDQLVARSETIDWGLFCATCWSYMTRLLNTPIIGRSAAPVASSCSDMLAGLSKNEILRMPPAFWASADCPQHITPSIAPATAAVRMLCVIDVPPNLSSCAPIAAAVSADDRTVIRSFVEPDVFHAPLVVDAVGHERQPLDPRLPAGGSSRIEQHRPNRCFRELPLDIPDDLFALLRIGFHRLLVHQFVARGCSTRCSFAPRRRHSSRSTSDPGRRRRSPSAQNRRYSPAAPFSDTRARCRPGRVRRRCRSP